MTILHTLQWLLQIIQHKIIINSILRIIEKFYFMYSAVHGHCHITQLNLLSSMAPQNSYNINTYAWVYKCFQVPVFKNNFICRQQGMSLISDLNDIVMVVPSWLTCPHNGCITGFRPHTGHQSVHTPIQPCLQAHSQLINLAA